MTRRIAITILLTVWSAIIVAGLGAWFSARFVLLNGLDESIIERARFKLAGKDNDRLVVKNSHGETITLPHGQASIPDPEPVSRGWVHLSDGWRRQIVFRQLGIPALVPYDAPADNYIRILQELALSLIVSGIIAGGLAALIAARLARISLRPLQQTADAIGVIDESKLDRRIESTELPVELRPMAGRLNEMLERLQKAFEQRRRFLADASHELRTPVAAMITSMEVALKRPRPAEELTETLQVCLSEAVHLRLLVQALLRQIRAEGALADEQLEPVDAGLMVRQCANLANSLAAEKQVRVVPSANGSLPVLAEPGRLRSVVLNLVGNAIEYNHPGGTVEVYAQAHNGSTEIVVKDDGPGIAPEHLPHLFQPFYRGTGARESDGHLGLGLFLVDSHVKA
ncbi:MAG TPA: ATP-binding protein, partial [Castellaniella sp.]|nr:ATP-binding protein [Castellaniella sp.]